MIVSGTCLNYLIGLGSILQLLGVMMDVLPLRGETEAAALCNVIPLLTGAYVLDMIFIECSNSLVL